LKLKVWQNAYIKDATAQDFLAQNVIHVVQFGVKMAIAQEHLIKSKQAGLMEQPVKVARKEK
jgi:hypothetical protein